MDIPKKHVAVVGGGTCTERESSLETAELVVKALTDAGYRVTFVDMDTEIAIKLSTLKPDVVFNCMQGIFGKDGCLPGHLNIMKLPYTHCGVLASSLASDKIKAKQWFRTIGLSTPDSVVIDKSDYVAGKSGDPMDRPYIIKPVAQGTSRDGNDQICFVTVPLSIYNVITSFRYRYVEAIFHGDDFDFASYTFPYGNQILVERFIKGREFTVAVLNGDVLGAAEVGESGASCPKSWYFFTSAPNQVGNLGKSKRFRDLETKYHEGFIKLSCPPHVSDSVNTELLASAEKIYKSLDCRGPIRIDYILEEKTDRLFVLEVNTDPGLGPMSDFPAIAAASRGMNLECIFDEILKSACCDFQ
ncbi:hypothetical protein V9T40_001745 [Parthenolecanium corni]|uniref:ATP-grasp domain-containing protein n=1 Tax=Parthenolecanium corni TaxID=536013 RepID=A0AAN9Y3R2_9HEMI